MVVVVVVVERPVLAVTRVCVNRSMLATGNDHVSGVVNSDTRPEKTIPVIFALDKYDRDDDDEKMARRFFI
jgi:hypothetical protein